MRDVEAPQERPETAPILGEVNGIDGRAEKPGPGALQRARELQRRLPSELHDHSLWPLGLDHGEHVVGGQRLEVEAVGGVVVGRHRLRVAVDHDGVPAGLAHRHRRVNTAVVEFDALADAIGSGSQDHD
jgi:hypothetical protein